MKHLLEEPVISFYPTAAILLGSGDRALILQQLHFLISSTERDERTYNFVNDRWWVYNTYSQWHRKYFKWISEDTIQRIFLFLEEKGIVLSMQSVKDPSDRTKWYSIDEEAWEKFISQPITANCDDGSPQTAVMITAANCGDDSTKSPSKEKKITSPSKNEGEGASRKGVNSFSAPEQKRNENDESPVKPSKLKSQPWLATELAAIFNRPKLGKEKLPLIVDECALADSDPMFRAWLEKNFLPAQKPEVRDGKPIFTKTMDDILAELKAKRGWEDYKTANAAPLSNPDLTTEEVMKVFGWEEI